MSVHLDGDDDDDNDDDTDDRHSMSVHLEVDGDDDNDDVDGADNGGADDDRRPVSFHFMKQITR